MRLSPDELIYGQWGPVKLNATIVFTWAIMAVLVIGSRLITRKLRTDAGISRWQSALEMVVLTISSQIGELGLREPRRYLGFLGTLFLLIAVSNLCTIIPYYEPPTGSISTTAALSLAVFGAVPVFGIRTAGWKAYLASYVKPSFILLPFNIIGEFSRTLALAVRLFGNIMSGSMILAILLVIAPLLFPVLMNVLGLLTGMVQAYIFSILAAVYIAAASNAGHEST
jgi:F-type H+-transporting ATPase subunit a